jgi:hypothetical protein
MTRILKFKILKFFFRNMIYRYYYTYYSYTVIQFSYIFVDVILIINNLYYNLLMNYVNISDLNKPYVLFILLIFFNFKHHICYL